jgi:SAM-dependent methyltransferase
MRRLSQASDPAKRFSDRAGAYSAHRPGYPDQVFNVLFAGLGVPGLVVADVGAGTGISTRLLAQRVRQVHAVEPNAKMREEATPLPNVEWCDGTGEHTGLPDQSVDVVVAMQAYHWFDPDAAWREFHRVARQRVAVVQYERDEREGSFARAYGAAIRPFFLDDTEARRLDRLEGFARRCGAGLVRAAVPSSDTLTLEGLLGRAASSSYLPRSPELQAALREVFAQHQRDGTVELGMTNHVLYCASQRA